MKNILSGMGMGAMVLAGAQPALAQTTNPVEAETKAANTDNSIADIIVTAQRRSERLQDVPIAITAISGDQLNAAGIQSTQDLAAATPGLSVGASAGYIQPRIRGIGTTASGAGVENPVATYVDGVYYASAPASVFTLSGVERVEILKGPQGTLFGRNATGGLIQVITRDPGSSTTGEAKLSYGNYGTLSADGYVAGPLADGLGATLTLHSSTMRDGYGHNLATGADVNKIDNDFSVRGKLVARIGDAKITLSGDYNVLEGSPQPGRLALDERNLLGFPGPNNPWDVNSDINHHTRSRGGGGSLTISAPLGFADLRSITAYRKSDFFTQFDGDNSPLPVQDFKITQHDRQISQEVQLASKPSSPVSWVLGGFYFDAESKFDPVDVHFGIPQNGLTDFITFSTQGTKSYSAFGQATVPLGESLKITGGLRYTSEKRTNDSTQFLTIVNVGTFPAGQSIDASATFKKLTFRTAIDYKIAKDVLFYVSFNRGFKSGGFNPSTPSDPAFKPEVLDAYEIGVKSDLFDRRVRLNVAGFYYDYSNIQVSVYSGTGLPTIQNGAKARVYGLDADATVLLGDNLRLTGGVSVLHDRFLEFPTATFNFPLPGGGSASQVGDASGNRLPITPDWTANLAATYTIPLPTGKILLDGNYQHSDGYFAEADNIRRQKPYNLLGGAITWKIDREERLSVSVWGRNLLNEAVALQIASNALATNASFQPPRTYGATLAFEY